MPVDSKHPEYKEHIDGWHRCRMLVAGSDKVKQAAEFFLPRLGGQDSIMYAAYKDRATFYAAAARTVEGLNGVVFRKQPSIAFPESKLDLLEQVTSDGAPLLSSLQSTFSNLLTVGRHGCLLDFETFNGAIEPYIAAYTAESILNWRASREVDGKHKLTMVVLKEDTYEVDQDDPFKLNDVELIRTLQLLTRDELEVITQSAVDAFAVASTQRVYTVIEWRKSNKSSAKEEWFISSVRQPIIRGKTLDYIPFVFFSPRELTPACAKSPIADICDLNVSHYRTSADLEHGRHFTALPTPWVAGFDSGLTLRIGSETAWVSEDPNAKAGYLEFTGQGLASLEKALDQKEAQMSVMGARLLETPKKAAEAADSHRQRRVGEDSIVASIAATVSDGYTRLLTWMAEWMAVSQEEISVELNTDYSNLPMDHNTLNALVAALQAGRISYDTFIYNLARGELLPEGRTAEEELNLIELESPQPARVPADNLEEDEEEDDSGSDDDEDDDEDEDTA